MRADVRTIVHLTPGGGRPYCLSVECWCAPMETKGGYRHFRKAQPKVAGGWRGMKGLSA